jgi:rhodanese-related sulfurtransferase
MMKNLIIAVSLCLLGISAQAVDIAVPATDVHARLQQADQKMLFVDVRDPVEIMFVGFTDAVHVNVPFLMVDRSAWDERRGVYKLTQNPDFVRQIKAELEKRGLDMDAEVITLCRSGSERGEPSAAFLLEPLLAGVPFRGVTLAGISPRRATFFFASPKKMIWTPPAHLHPRNDRLPVLTPSKRFGKGERPFLRC